MESVKRTVGLYRQLFSLPSDWLISGLAFISSLCYSILISFFTGWNLLFLFACFGLSYLSSSLVAFLLLRKGNTVTLRRAGGTTLFAVNVSGLVMVLFSIFGAFLLGSSWYLNGLLLGSSLVLFLNLIVYFSIVKVARIRIYISSYIYPVMMVLTVTLIGSPSNLFYLPFLLRALLIHLVMHLGAESFLSIVDTPAKQLFNIGGIELFRGFAEEWLEGKGTILENAFEQIGIQGSCRVSTLRFSNNSKSEFALVIPEIHPGPFMTLGSSALPIRIIEALDINSTVAHGACTHEHNLVTRAETARAVKTINKIIAGAKPLSLTITKPVRITCGKITITCQMIGKLALLVYTCAPYDYDDITQEVGQMVIQTAKDAGAIDAIFIDSHNSISSLSDSIYPDMKEAKDLTSATKEAVTKALTLHQYPIKAGFARISPKEISRLYGLGPGGIAAITFEISKELFVYVIIDSNNMIQGLRSKILDALHRRGYSPMEIMTSDTHIVSALRTSNIGFNPLGESGGHERIVDNILDVVEEAISKLESNSIGYNSQVIEGLKILGKTNYDNLTNLISGSSKLAKNTIVRLLPVLIFSVLILLVLI